MSSFTFPICTILSFLLHFHISRLIAPTNIYIYKYNIITGRRDLPVNNSQTDQMAKQLDLLPHDCISHILSFGSPPDACRSAAVSSAIRSAADSDAVWERFLPADYPTILSRLVLPPPSSSKKHLFLALCNPLLIDDGTKSFSLERATRKICYRLSARELAITWAANPLYWAWKCHFHSRFAEVAELRTVWWLEIIGKINTRMLSPNTKYGAYLIVQFANHAYGLDSLPSEVSLQVGNYKSQGTIYLRPQKCKKHSLEQVYYSNRIGVLRSRVSTSGEERSPKDREDGWVEIELGEFYNGGERDEEVNMSLKEIKGVHLKGGLVVEGIEIRPKE
ncbi:F-box protein PP2-B15-like [Malania oleifera]|uniref:F-box protein PP2-B15-like n=1 Tax=Malania oleifera TaxID=397392 RepID=UPI0025AEBD1E|nr:F-box protein PP2-B15-like [Malania oleifera]